MEASSRRVESSALTVAAASRPHRGSAECAIAAGINDLPSMPSLRNQSWSVNPTGMPHNSAGIAGKAEEEKRRMSTAHAGGVHSQGVEADSCNYENDVCCNEDAVEDNETDFAAIGNGCGEAVSSPSSCAEAFLLGPSLAVASRPAEWSLRSLPAASASAGKVGFTAAPPPPPLPPHPPVAASATAAAAEKSRPPSFTAQAMRAITSNAEAAAPPPFSSRHPSPSFPATTAAAAAARAVTGEDPMGVRQLYSLPPSVAGSCLSVSSLNRRGPGGCGSSGIVATTAAAEALPSPHHLPTSIAAAAAGGSGGGDAFSMERFATFYEVALEELMSECERRVANAPAAWRAGQRRFLRGESNHDLATSTFSFDSPRSSGVSPVSGYAPQFGSSPSWNAPAYPPCFPAPGHNTHGLQTRGVAAQGSARTSAPPPPPALPSRHFFFSAATSGSAAAAAAAARSAEAEGDVATEETVPALLAALGRHHGKMAPMVFIAALAYLARVTVHCVSEFLSITHANWYRLTTTAILVAAKVYDEHSSSRLNRHFARSSGIPLSELTRLELDFLYLSDFDLLLKEAEVEQWLTWMETLAVRRDVMTPLQTYFMHRPDATHAAFGGSNVGRTASLPSSSLCSAVLPESLEKSRANTAATTGATTAETSRTAGLSSEGTVVAATAAETASATSPLSAPAPRTFTHVRVGSNTMGGNTVSQQPQPSCAVSGQRRLTGALSEAPASSAIPLHDLLHSPMLRSPVSSLAMPQSLFDGPRSTVSGVSLPGSATTPVVGLRATAVPPSPVHGVLSLCPPPHRSRLFSVVHGKREPPSPRSVRQLSRLGASPPSPLQPPPMEPHSPVGFFKQQSMQAGSGMGYGHRHSGSAVSGHGLQGAGMSASMASNTGVRAARDRSSVSDYAQPPATGTAAVRRQTGKEDRYSSSSTHTDPAAASAPSMSAASTNANGSGTRWGPFGMVQQVRDVLGVTASLVRGQLNVLAPAKAPEAAPPAPSRPLAHDTSSNSRHEQPYKPAYHHPSPAKMSSSSTNRVSAPAAAEATSPQAVSPGRHGHRAQEHSSTRSPRARSTRQQQQEQVDDVSGAAGYDYEEEGEYDEEDGEYYEEDAYGYYDEDGYYYPYEEGEEGEYDEEGEEEWYAEPEPEEETEYFQRCRLPLTHSPPSL